MYKRQNIDRANTYEIPVTFYKNLQKGEDYRNAKGTIVPNEEVTLEPKKALSYAYCADTLFTETYVNDIKNADLLYHETTFLNKDFEKAKKRFHCTTGEAASIAKLANVGTLLIGHFSSRYEILDEFLEEAKEIFPNTKLAIEGSSYVINDLSA